MQLCIGFNKASYVYKSGLISRYDLGGAVVSIFMAVSVT